MHRAFSKTGVLLTLIVLVSACGPATTVVTPTAALALPSPTSTPVPFTEATTPQPTEAPSPAEPEPAAGSVSFNDSGQELGGGHSTDVALGDLDGDGDLDAMVGNEGQAQVWLNDGRSGFSPNGQDLTIPSGWNMGLDLGDLDGDGDLDAFIVVAAGPGRVLLNQGGAQRGITSSFADSGQQLVAFSGFGFDLDLGDIDGDGDLDAYVAHERANLVWLNDGQGVFQDSGQRLGGAITADVALADLDGDGDLDALAGGWDEPARVWLNDGQGAFADSGHILTAAAVHIHDLDVGDLDGDGDLDVFLALASGHPNQVWFNDGQGVFSDSGQQLPSALGHAVVLGDLDGDGDLDAFVANAASSAGAPNTVWLNDGQGNFSDSGLRLGNGISYGVDLGDLDGDGDLDAFVANNSPPNAVWLNGWYQAAPPSQAIISAGPVPAMPVPPTVTSIPPTPAPTALPGALTVAAPPGNPPTLDGTLSPGEWDSARREKFSDGSELLLMQNEGYLYLGIRAAGHSIWSVFLDRGDEIAVLHTSGSLGTAVYKRTGSGWQRTRMFDWTLGDKSNSETARQQRKQFLEKEGWLASLGTMGKPEEVEFQLAMPQGALRLTAAFPLPPDYDEAALWPVGLDDDVHTIDLLEGDAPAQAQFSPDRWAVVMIAGYEAAGPTPTPVSEATPIPPDGRSAGLIAFYSERDGNPEIYTVNADGSAETRLTFNPADDLAPDISPDGSQIVFVSDWDGNEEVYRMSYDGSDVVRLTHTPAQESYPYWSPDGTKIVFCSKRDDGQTYEVHLMNSDGTDQTRITRNSVSEEWAYLSPDMQKMVYAVGPFPQYNLYVMSVDGSEQRQVFSCDRMAAFPKWSRDGRTIAFNYALLSSGNILGDVGLINSDGEDFRLITTTGGNSVSENPYWSPDGSRIVFQSNRTGSFQIYVMNADGSEQVRLTHHRGNDYWPSWGGAGSP